MTYLHPSGASGDGTRGGGFRRHRARHDGAAPDPYASAPDGADGYRGDPYWPGGYAPEPYGSEPYGPEAYGSEAYGPEPYGPASFGPGREGREGGDRAYPPAGGGGRRDADRYPVADHPTDQYPANRHPGDRYPGGDPYPGDRYPGDRYPAAPPTRVSPAEEDTAFYPALPRAVPPVGGPAGPRVDAEPDPVGRGPTPYPDDPEPRRRGPGRRRSSGRRGRPAPADAAGEPTVGATTGAATTGAAPSGGRTSRAGRNLPAAIGVGVTLVAVVLASLYFWKPAFLAVVVAAVLLGTWEMVRAVRPSGANPPLPPLAAGGAVMTVLAWLGGADALSLGLLVTVLAALVWRLADGAANFQRDITSASLIASYVPFLAGFAVLLAVPDDGANRVLVTLAAVILSDTGGYVAGVFFGKHPMAPTVSPKKSWEGLAGSLVATAVGSAVLLALLLDVAPWWGAAFGLAVSVAAVLGDLAESMIKRDLGVKDMSGLLPGHGGLMDRLDSILFAVPTSYLVLSLLLPPGV